MNVHISENAERIIRSQVESGRFASEEAVIEEAVRQLETKAPLRDSNEVAIAADQELQRKLYAAGLLSEIKPPITDFRPWQGREAILVEGESLSEMIIRERR
jgi:putative addiction module CopG family antidote